MNKPVKTKLCWNCEGSVSRTIENCPYCGVYLSPESSEELSQKEEALQPPYSSQDSEQKIPEALYTPSQEAEEAASLPEKKDLSPMREIFLPILFLSAGSLLFLFSLLILLFSNQGALTLVWNEEYWLYFFLASLPCLLLGYKFIQS